MNKSWIAAATFAALTAGFAGSANAGVTGHGLGGVRATVNSEVSQAHWRKHHWRWNHRHHKRKVCVWRHHHKRCWWR